MTNGVETSLTALKNGSHPVSSITPHVMANINARRERIPTSQCDSTVKKGQKYTRSLEREEDEV